MRLSFRIRPYSAGLILVLFLISGALKAQPIAPVRDDFEDYSAYSKAYTQYIQELSRWRSENQKREATERANELARWQVETFKIDNLIITVKTREEEDICSSGARHIMGIQGLIGPDSSFAVKRLLERFLPCRSTEGRLIYPVTAELDSGGGFLSHGYALGHIFREHKVATKIRNGSSCASSCAVAFLGGDTRLVESNGSILFHAPYFSDLNEYGKRDISCEVGQEALDELLSYYQLMTDAETGERLFERTMWYCSADDGWVVTGGSAAELYGIATEK